MAVLSTPDAKTYLGITVSTHDDTLEGIIAAAEAAIAQKCGPLEPVARTVRVSAGSASMLVLPAPIVEITLVADADGNVVDATDLYVDQEAGLLSFSDGQWFTARWYDVTYEQGREPCPADLLLAVKELVRHLWESQRGSVRRPGSTVGEATANTIPGAAYMMPFRVSELIAPHLRPSVA